MEVNEIEEAIRWFDGRDKRYALGDKCAKMERIALEALKEKQERDSRSHKPLRCDSCKELLFLLPDFKCKCGHAYHRPTKEDTK